VLIAIVVIVLLGAVALFLTTFRRDKPVEPSGPPQRAPLPVPSSPLPPPARELRSPHPPSARSPVSGDHAHDVSTSGPPASRGSSGMDAGPASRESPVRDARPEWLPVPTEACDKVLDGVKELDASSSLASRLLQLLEDPNAASNAIAAQIRMDLALSATVLRAANSAFYSRASGEVRDVTEALVVLGYDSIRQLVVGRLCRGLPRKQNETQQLLWRHALATGLGAQACARIVRGVTVGHAFTAGLFHDVGKTVLHDASSSTFGKIAELAASGRATDDIERELFGTDHAEVGAELLRRWRLPLAYESVTRFHHRFEKPPSELGDKERRLLHIVVLGGAVATHHGRGSTVTGRGAVDLTAHPALQALRADASILETMQQQIARELSELEAIFG
jgi:putative nucleotidyltransferase with HDIG domain